MQMREKHINTLQRILFFKWENCNTNRHKINASADLFKAFIQSGEKSKILTTKIFLLLDQRVLKSMVT